MGYEFIKVERKGHLTILTINRSEVRNALHPPACKEMDEAFNEFSEDPDAWIGIVTGAGNQAFCAGNDLKWQAEHGKVALREGLDSLKGGFGGIARRFDCFKPMIAAVNGFAMGGGFEIALACDVIIAAEHARFGLPEVKVGMIAGGGGVHRLPRHMPYHLAMGLIYTGRHITAQEAQNLGIVSEIVAPDDLLRTAERWAEEILACAPLAVRAAKEASLRGLEMPLNEAIVERFPGWYTMMESEDYEEGPKAFAEKRTPQWKGR
ncbi:enoyl-CoA hydratase-related protein [Thermodesulfobacteriota bacterium]